MFGFGRLSLYFIYHIACLIHDDLLPHIMTVLPLSFFLQRRWVTPCRCAHHCKITHSIS